jgi:outer membrane protein TolC
MIAMVLPVTTTGCLVGPNYRPLRMKLPGHWNGADEKPEQISQGGKTDRALWWRSLNDPLLDQLITQALSSNLDEKVALARIREERAYLVMSRAGLFPSIDTSGYYTRQRYSANTPLGCFLNKFQENRTPMKSGSTRAGNWMSLAASAAAWKPRGLSLRHRSKTSETCA